MNIWRYRNAYTSFRNDESFEWILQELRQQQSGPTQLPWLAGWLSINKNKIKILKIYNAI